MESFVRSALQAADLPASGFTCEPLGRQAVNATALIRYDNGDRYIVRIYRWPFDVPDELDRPTKEVWLAGLLRDHDIPAARVLSRVDAADQTAVVLTFLPGVPLGDLPDKYDDAWRDVGRCLAAVHRIQIGDAAGMISGRSVQPFLEGSWGQWQLANAANHAAQVASRGMYHLDVDRIHAIYQRAIPLFDARPVRLLHNDPHAWNVIVDQSGGRWRCAGWLDWEFAWTGDPAWDVARLDIFRSKNIGPTPPSFYEGYGSDPAPIVSDLYELAIFLWMSNEAATGDQIMAPTYRQAHRYLQQAPAVLTRLEQRLVEQP